MPSNREEEISKKERVRAVYELRQKHPLADLLAAARIARSTYYYTLKQLDRPDAYKEKTIHPSSFP